MADFHGYSSQAYAPTAPSAPPMPESSSGHPSTTQNPYQYQPPPPQASSNYGHPYPPNPSPWGGGAGGGAGYPYFPPGTHPEIVRSFQAVDRDRSGFIDELELQAALSSGYQRFSIRTVRWLMCLFKNPNRPSMMGPAEFAALWNCLGQWRAIFDRFDRDHSGKIDVMELRDALHSLGYAVPPSVIQLLLSKDEYGRGLTFDNFIECGMIVKGLTDKFKEKDIHYSGSATFRYDDFMSTVIPFIVP